ncbi:hypothetical protein IMZ08_18745 [Bacillus luteolus]|uniref:Lipoprotein n=1 Tax=Litchfieldia luteola TaxID=682179 RepID=A0ABR9QNJ1_9BACI|nr:hypothetical protein [Cytobacillus luteolus]MBE4910078.1 hypothetical protein [Cytobacillus luteolus]MBP1942359.1 hypothetical protein [Cytobacillus luteolus]
MKKGIIKLFILNFFLITLLGCSQKVPNDFDLNQLTRVDVQIFDGEDNEKENIITDEKTITTLREMLGKIEWEFNVKAKMTRKEDVKATLFFTFDKNMPERLLEYFIWFNQGDDSVTFIDREKNALGTFNKEDAQILKNILENN